MMSYVAAKLGRALFVLLALSFLTYVVLEATPGSVANSILGPNATQQQVADLEAGLGLDRPMLVRYWEWLTGAIRGDLGVSPLTSRPVAETVFTAAGTTIQLVLLGTALALLIAVASALLAARFPNGIVDRLGGMLTSITIAVPTFVAGPILAYVFAVKLGFFPVAGFTPFSESPGEYLNSVALPVICIAITELATYQRLLRADMIAVLTEPYVEAARTRGIRERRILFRHAFRPAVIPTTTVLGLSVGRMIGGTVIVENLFGIPGMGKLVAQAILSRDLLVVQGVVLVIGVVFVLINTLIDLAYGFIDPRVRVRERVS